MTRPPREWQMVSWDTPADKRRRRDARRVEELLTRPHQMAAFLARLVLLAEARSQASRAQESRHCTGGATDGVTAPGPASMVETSS